MKRKMGIIHVFSPKTVELGRTWPINEPVSNYPKVTKIGLAIFSTVYVVKKRRKNV